MSEPTFHFDPQLVEHSRSVETTEGTVTVQIHKIGGGTLGRAYDGYWGYRLSRGGDQTIAAGGDLRTGMPKTHEEVVAIALDFFGIEHDLREAG